MREITQEPPFWRRLSFGWHGLLYYKEVQHIPRGEHDPPLENAKRIDLDRCRQADGVMGARRRSDGMNLKRKMGPVQLAWSGAKAGAKQARGIECVWSKQPVGKWAKCHQKASGLVRKPRHRVRSAQYNVFEGRPDQIGCHEQRRTEQRC